MRFPADAKGTCVALLPQLGKQPPPRVHHAIQCSWPASFAGGQCSRIIFRVIPPGRSEMLVNSASPAGLSMRVTAMRESVVSVDTPERVDACVAAVDALPARGAAHGQRMQLGARVEISLGYSNPVGKIVECTATQFLQHCGDGGYLRARDAIHRATGHQLHVVMHTHLDGPNNMCMVQGCDARVPG